MVGEGISPEGVQGAQHVVNWIWAIRCAMTERCLAFILGFVFWFARVGGELFSCKGCFDDLGKVRRIMLQDCPLFKVHTEQNHKHVAHTDACA